jgi:WD40-like Beta Propeller Repeat
VSHQNLVDRRTLLLGTAALAASCSRVGHKTAQLGTLAYVDLENLWLRDLPGGQPRRVASGHRIAWPQVPPSCRWISFQDGNSGRVVSTDARLTAGVHWNTGELGQSPLNWLGNRDELAVRVVDSQSGDPGNRLDIFTESDNWRAPQRSIPLGIDADSELAIAVDRTFTQYAYSLTTPVGENSDGSGRFQTALLLSSFGKPGESKRLAESAGFFDIAGFTPSGKWLLYWKSDDIGAAIREDGLDFFAVHIADGKPRGPKIATLVYKDMFAICPTKEIVAVTLGLGRETWANKAIAIVDMSGEPSVRVVTERSAAAQLPAWSPDGETLAWCSGPDAEFLDKQKLLAKGRKTITVEGPRTGERREIPITPELRIGAAPETIDRCMRLRRIYAASAGKLDQPRQLTNDPRYSDEGPVWSADGSHILFGRVDARNAWTIWLMRNDGSEARQIAGPMRPPADLTDEEKFSYKQYYGHTEWRSLFDWWHGPAA